MRDKARNHLTSTVDSQNRFGLKIIIVKFESLKSLNLSAVIKETQLGGQEEEECSLLNDLHFICADKENDDLIPVNALNPKPAEASLNPLEQVDEGVVLEMMSMNEVFEKINL
ncbi:hypothetical protein CAEBREN_02822 [Caenorhabditis brenneri]|uniref:Uncharacterized protein n=1 Tax=Caenorhabditis brenneri TaxID=135651 RepID=G0P404_CAEBE|nr:hypothetical protein CAEBREN_02822 [Caenorhabditis brenneri]